MKKQLRKLKLWELGISEWPYQISYETVKEVVDRNLYGSAVREPHILYSHNASMYELQFF